MKLALWLLVLALLSACGQSAPNSRAQSKSSTDSLSETLLKQGLIDSNGTFVAVLRPLNLDTVGFSSGAVTVNIVDDEFITNVRFTGPAPATIHSQSIHIGSFCPTEIGDENMDGHIDIIESLPYTSEVLIPLDSDLNSQTAGQGFYPLSDDWGTYTYSKTSSYSALLADLYLPDESHDDELTKLIPNSPLQLDEKVVVIYGAPDTHVLPSTVGSLHGLTPNQSIPIACGQFKRFDRLPGVLEPDEAPAPAPTDVRHPNRPTTTTNSPSTRNGTSGNSVSRNGSAGSTGTVRPQNNHRSNNSASPLCRRDKACHQSMNSTM